MEKRKLLILESKEKEVVNKIEQCDSREEERKENERKQKLLDEFLQQKEIELQEDEQEVRRRRSVLAKLDAAAKSGDQNAYNLCLSEVMSNLHGK